MSPCQLHAKASLDGSGRYVGRQPHGISCRCLLQYDSKYDWFFVFEHREDSRHVCSLEHLLDNRERGTVRQAKRLVESSCIPLIG